MTIKREPKHSELAYWAAIDESSQLPEETEPSFWANLADQFGRFIRREEPNIGGDRYIRMLNEEDAYGVVEFAKLVVTSLRQNGLEEKAKQLLVEELFPRYPVEFVDEMKWRTYLFSENIRDIVFRDLEGNYKYGHQAGFLEIFMGDKCIPPLARAYQSGAIIMTESSYPNCPADSRWYNGAKSGWRPKTTFTAWPYCKGKQLHDLHDLLPAVGGDLILGLTFREALEIGDAASEGDVYKLGSLVFERKMVSDVLADKNRRN